MSLRLCDNRCVSESVVRRTPARHNSPNLDILRAVAVLTVVVDHLIPTFRFRGHTIPHMVSELTLHIGQAGDCEIAWLNRAAERVATYSYGIYLLHVPALHIVFSIWQPGSLAVELPLFLALTAVLAVAAYHLIEAPMVRLGRRLSAA